MSERKYMDPCFPPCVQCGWQNCNQNPDCGECDYREPKPQGDMGAPRLQSAEGASVTQAAEPPDPKGPRVYKLEEYGNQHNNGIKAKLLNGTGGWDDLELPGHVPLMGVEKFAYDAAIKNKDFFYKSAQDALDQVIRLCDERDSLKAELERYRRSSWDHLNVENISLQAEVEALRESLNEISTMIYTLRNNGLIVTHKFLAAAITTFELNDKKANAIRDARNKGEK